MAAAMAPETRILERFMDDLDLWLDLDWERMDRDLRPGHAKTYGRAAERLVTSETGGTDAAGSCSITLARKPSGTGTSGRADSAACMLCRLARAARAAGSAARRPASSVAPAESSRPSSSASSSS